ncbi:ECF-type sigma factor [Hyphomonas sp.]|uniref:ECF-type sigma factor n=1 Tax=Hyphomonas sp. TaxID=87 RepID=UPI00391B69B6
MSAGSDSPAPGGEALPEEALVAALSPRERDRLLGEVYDELRLLARKILAGDRARQHIAPTELVNGAAIKVMNQRQIPAQRRTHFFAYSAHIMRQVLIDEVRRERAAKRGGPKVTLITEIAESAAPDDSAVDVEVIHDALSRLAEVDPALARLVELRYFSGLTLEEIAELDNVSLSTIKRQWRVARAWLHDALKP